MEHYLGEEIKKLGLGMMRLPMNGNEVDIEQTKAMTDLFIKEGFTYFDTAYPYLDGRSEEVVKEVLVDRYPRASYQLATKLPIWLIKEKADMQRIFDEQLKKTGAGFFDYYLLHGLDKDRASFCEEIGVWEFVKELKDNGLIKHYGFSFHDTADVLEDILKKHGDAQFVQLQINYCDWEDSIIQSRKCYEAAVKYHKPVLIMEPVKGGSLANLLKKVADILKTAAPQVSAASWAMRFAASLDGLITVLSGMSDMEQMQDNISYMKELCPLTEMEYKVLGDVTNTLKSMPLIPCTNCRYCVKDCPQNIAIPGVFGEFNDYQVFQDLKKSQSGYKMVTGGGGKASDCVQCGQCEEQCPQHIKVMEKLNEIAGVLE